MKNSASPSVIFYSKTKIAFTGFIQVYFVSINTYFIAHELLVGVLFAAFIISLVWSFNVKKIAFGSNADRVTYAAGAALGSVAGLASSVYLYRLFNYVLNAL